MNRLVELLDGLSELTGRAISWLTAGMVLVTFVVVVLRYVFDMGWIAMQESILYFHAAVFMLGAAYTLKRGGHVRVDIFTSRMPMKLQGVIGVLTNMVFFLPVMVLMTIASWQYALTSIAGRELNATSWAPPIYPIKTLMAISFSFLLIQGFSNLIHDIRVMQGKAEGMR